jgi:hypothetical protein
MPHGDRGLGCRVPVRYHATAGESIPHRHPSPAEQTSAKIFDAFREGLRDLGYIDGQDIRIEYRLAAWDYSRLPGMAEELVRLPVDVIVTDTQKSAVIAHEAP